MIPGGTIGIGARRAWAAALLCVLAMFAMFAMPAVTFAQSSVDCSAFPNNTIDGTIHSPPSQITIDGHCTIRNFPQSNPLDSNINFNAPGGGNWLSVFDNVHHTGQMACNQNDIHQHKIWYVNGSISGNVQPHCRDAFIPVEKISKQNPPGPATATIGVPFTYTLTIPVLFDPLSGTVVDFTGSPNDLHAVVVWDDLNATGVDLSYVGHTAYWSASGEPLPHQFSNANGFLTFDFSGIPVIPSETQFVVELTVVLEDTPANAPGTQFVNTATWEFGRLIDGVFYQPLPGEWGITEPMMIAAPQLIVTKTGPATLGRTMNLGQWGEFRIDVHNAGLADAWDVTLIDRLPDGADGGMCDIEPEILSARVFAADGVTTIPGKDALVAGTDFALSWTGRPGCEFTLTALTPAAVIGADERLIIDYRTRLDPHSQDGAMLTNVVGATQWFNDGSANADRVSYTRTITDGTVGVADHEDAHTVTVALFGLFFEKTVLSLTSGANPATAAEPGETLRYTLRLQTTELPLDDFRFFDDLGRLNAAPVFVPGSLTLVPGSLPPGADASGTDPNGGTNGAGLVDIRGLSLPVFSELRIEFDVTLADRIANGTYVTNQAELLTDVKLADSDDPNVNGQADPEVVGDEDPTRVLIVSAPEFEVHKVSAYLDDDPEVLLAGERLRYTITVRNYGTEDAHDATLVDQIPANTTYIPGSTRLNGVLVPDGPDGLPPLADGLPLSTPLDPTPGFMPAGSAPADGNVATIVFDVRVNPDVIDGTIISNQAFLSAPASDVFDQPSDDPRTPAPNDPTRDVVGALPFLYAEKFVALEVDGGTPDIVDPGDVLRYTIRVHNNGKIPATEVMLRDDLPENTTYVADSLTLNGLPVGQPDGGLLPLIAGIGLSSTDLTPPVPDADGGTISAGEMAVVQFDLRVNDGVAPGTLIVNQAVIASVELADLLTDGDGDPSTGPQPTVVVVGDVQQLRISKGVAVVGGGPALAGATVEYVVSVVNIGAVPAYDVVIRDDLDQPEAGQLRFVDESWRMNGSTDGIVVADSLLTADYAGVYGALLPGRSITLRFQAVLYEELPMGTRVTNVATVYWGDPEQTASASVSIDIGGTPGVGTLSGHVWHDANFDAAPDENERKLEGWFVDLHLNDELMHTTTTDPDGTYRIVGLAPNYETENRYELRFRRPGAGPNTALLGRAHSDFTNDLQRISDIEVRSGSNLLDLNLPIDPNGVVYNSLSRVPITGATLTMVQAGTGTALADTCFYDPAQQGQVTLGDGYYKFDLSFSDPSCPTGGGYLIRVVPPSSTYLAGYSELIPPLSDETTEPFSVPGCPGTGADAVPGTPLHCEAQPSELAPPATVAPRTAGTRYYLHLLLDNNSPPGTSQIFNNHIPLDIDLDDSVTITKTTPMVHVTRGQLVPYVITVASGIGADISSIAIADRIPAGFRYVAGSARLNGVPAEPEVNGRELVWTDLTVESEGRHTLMLLLAIGSGVGEGEFVNRVQVFHALTGHALSGQATATVRIVPDPALDCTDVIGKVFDDVNRNGLQDPGERGIPGVRIVSARGLAATTDQYGRFHITCAITPREGRGSNFVLKLDDRTLPSGFRASTEMLQVQRATRGKMLEFNFAASIHRVIGLDVADPVFEPGASEMREIWQPRIDLLITELAAAPAVLRLSYLADLENPRLVDQRLRVVRSMVLDAWHASEQCCSYELVVEQEVFWRRGAPLEGSDRRRRNREGRR
jgi:large repetitive protein